MAHTSGHQPLDWRAHFRIQVSSRPAVACRLARTTETPSIFDGVFCVKGGDRR